MPKSLSEQNIRQKLKNKEHYHVPMGITTDEAIDLFKECLQQKPLKLNYLTEEESRMSDKEVNLQIVLALQLCDTKKDVCNLLDEIRTHERLKLVRDLEK